MSYDDDFQNVVATVFNKIAENTITFKDISENISENESLLNKEYAKAIYNSYIDDNDEKLNKIKKLYMTSKNEIKEIKERFNDLYNKRKNINFILNLHDYTLSDKDLKYIFDGIILD